MHLCASRIMLQMKIICLKPVPTSSVRTLQRILHGPVFVEWPFVLLGRGILHVPVPLGQSV